MYKEIVNKIKPECEKVLAFLEEELAKIRTGRASISLVEDISVDCFGQKFPLKQLGAISLPESRQILIQPWDQSYIEGIANSLQKSNLGTSPIIDKDSIRINLPPVSEEYRKNLLKIISEKQENAKKRIRNLREMAWDETQKKFQEGKVREDDKFRAKDELQEIVDEYNGKITDIIEKKRKEILE